MSQNPLDALKERLEGIDTQDRELITLKQPRPTEQYRIALKDAIACAEAYRDIACRPWIGPDDRTKEVDAEVTEEILKKK